MQNILLILILIGAVVGIPLWLKKRKEKNIRGTISNRKEKNEVWKTIKQYLKDSNEYGKEIVNCYVVKRLPVDYINPNGSHYLNTKTKYFNKLRDLQLSKTLSKEELKKIKLQKTRDLYVVCFQTKNIKNNTLDQPRAIECEVLNTKINRKEWDRKIVINGLVDYNKEMEWIAPIKAEEELKMKKADEAAKKKERKKLERQKKAQQKQREKNAKK